MGRITDQSFTRRDFVKTTAATAALATAGAQAATPKKKSKLRAAVCGIRNRGWQIASNFHHSGQFDVVTLCDPDDRMYDRAMKELKKRKVDIKPKFVKDFREVLDDKSIDAVAVTCPDHWHALIAVMAMEAGKSVYVEKPIGYDVHDGQAMVAAQQRYPKQVIQVGTQQRSNIGFLKAKEFIAEGGLGKVGFARGWANNYRGAIPIVEDSEPPKELDYELWTGPAPMRPYNKNRVHYNWHFMKGYGTGDVANWGVHWLDSIRHVLDLDMPERVSSQGYSLIKDAKEWPDTHHTIYHYPDFTVIWELRNWVFYNHRGKGVGMEIQGEKGAMVITRGGWTFYPLRGEPVKQKGVGGGIAHAKNFAASIRGKEKPHAPITEGHKSTTMCHLANVTDMAGHEIVWDAEKERVANDDDANQFLTREYRDPWKLPTWAKKA